VRMDCIHAKNVQGRASRKVRAACDDMPGAVVRAVAGSHDGA
jgi:hypothetical protein